MNLRRFMRRQKKDAELAKEIRTTSRQRFNMLLLTIFGVSGLLMAVIGVYDLMPIRSSSVRRSSAFAWRLERRPPTFETW